MLVEALGILKNFKSKRAIFSAERVVAAVRGVDLQIGRRETVGLVGESGCGKSTLGRCLLRLSPVSGGSIRFGGKDITHLTTAELSPFRSRMQIIFQDPFSALNPRASVASILEEPLEINSIGDSAADRRNRVSALAEQVGLSGDALDRYPHEFSGGQRQRIGIARAIAVRPEFIVCDEPVSALDVSIQAQIINLLIGLQEELEMSYLFVSHDLRIVRHISNRVMVMYLGQIVEEGPVEEIYKHPLHPYTQALLSAVPRIRGQRQRISLGGEPPEAAKIPTGCTFHPRCPIAEARCRVEVPILKPVDEKRRVACLLVTP